MRTIAPGGRSLRSETAKTGKVRASPRPLPPKATLVEPIGIDCRPLAARRSAPLCHSAPARPFGRALLAFYRQRTRTGRRRTSVEGPGPQRHRRASRVGITRTASLPAAGPLVRRYGRRGTRNLTRLVTTDSCTPRSGRAVEGPTAPTHTPGQPVLLCLRGSETGSKERSGAIGTGSRPENAALRFRDIAPISISI